MLIVLKYDYFREQLNKLNNRRLEMIVVLLELNQLQSRLLSRHYLSVVYTMNDVLYYSRKQIISRLFPLRI